MKRLIFDHLRRWGWLWAIIGIANGFMSGAAAGDQHKVFDALSFPILLWLGAMQLQQDLIRGICRVQTTLPVTAQTIGRAWWTASVGLPSLLLFITTGLALLIHCLHAGNPFPTQYFVTYTTTNCLFLGVMFSLFVDELPGLPQTSFEWLRRILSVLLMIGMVFSLIKSNSPFTLPLLIIAAIVTVIGWFRAEQMVVRRATFKPGIQRGKNLLGQHRAPSGFGGLPFLWQTLAWQIVRMFLMLVAWFLVMQLFMGGQFKMSPQKFINATMPALSTFGFFALVMFNALPMMMQLRHLRTLPISTTALAAIMVLPSTLAVFGVGAILAAINGNILDIPTGIFPYAAAISLSAPLLVGQGARTGSFIATLLLMMFAVSIFIFVPLKMIPTLVIISVSLAVIVASFEITRRLLKSSSKAYRPLPTNMNQWGAWR